MSVYPVDVHADNYTRRYMADVTVEQLETQIQRAASCGSITLPSGQLKPLLNLAMKKSLRDSVYRQIATRRARFGSQTDR